MLPQDNLLNWLPLQYNLFSDIHLIFTLQLVPNKKLPDFSQTFLEIYILFLTYI